MFTASSSPGDLSSGPQSREQGLQHSPGRGEWPWGSPLWGCFWTDLHANLPSGLVSPLLPASRIAQFNCLGHVQDMWGLKPQIPKFYLRVWQSQGSCSRLQLRIWSSWFSSVVSWEWSELRWISTWSVCGHMGDLFTDKTSCKLKLITKKGEPQNESLMTGSTSIKLSAV